MFQGLINYIRVVNGNVMHHTKRKVKSKLTFASSLGCK